MTHSTSSIRRFLLCVFLSAGFLIGCQNSNSVTPSALPPTSQTVSPTSAPIVIPTDAVGRVVLVAPPGVDAIQQQAVQAVLQELSDSAGYALEVRTDLPTGVVGKNWKMIYLLGSLPNQNELVSSAPATQFVAFDGIDLLPSPNVSFLRINPAYRTFMAGYIGALVAPDWRVAALLPSENPELADAFLNGGQYWCGRCGQNNPPFLAFPTTQALPSGSQPGEWQTAVAELLKFNSEVIYISPEAFSPDLLISLAGQNLLFIGSQTPPEEVRDKWIATLNQDVSTSIRTIWPDLIAGNGGKTYDVTLEIADVNEIYLSPGKLRLIQETMDALTGETISPFSVAE